MFITQAKSDLLRVKRIVESCTNPIQYKIASNVVDAYYKRYEEFLFADPKDSNDYRLSDIGRRLAKLKLVCSNNQ